MQTFFQSWLKFHYLCFHDFALFQYYSVKFDGGIGLMYSITNLKTSITQQVQNQLLWYNASTGNEASPQQSGKFKHFSTLSLRK